MHHLPKRCVEAQGCAEEEPIRGPEVIGGGHPGDVVGQGAVGKLDALGLARGARGEDHKGQIVSAQDRASKCRARAPRGCHGPEAFQPGFQGEGLGAIGPRLGGGEGNQARGLEGLQDPRPARRAVLPIQGYIGEAGLPDRQDSQHRQLGPIERNADGLPGTCARAPILQGRTQGRR